MRSLSDWSQIFESRRCYRSRTLEGQKRMKQVLQYLGPLRHLATNVVFVTGTMGKSGTCRCLEMFAVSAKKRVGVLVSSYLYSLQEMIRIQGKVLPEEYLCELFEQTFPIVEKFELNHFEWLLFIALWVFKNALLDLVVLEIELGGDHACIDLLEADVAVITSIDYDHLEELGETREEIASRKAKILKAGRYAVIGESDPPAILRTRIKELAIKVKWIGQDWSYQVHRYMRGSMKTLYIERLEIVSKKLPISSIATAVITWEILYGKVSPEHLMAWINECSLAAHFEVLSGDPPLILDVASNPKSVRYLFLRLKDFEKLFDLRGWHAICGMQKRSLWEESLMPWTLEEDTRWYFPKINDEMMAPEALRKIFLKERSMVCDNALIALHQARLDACIKGAGVVVFGSEEIIRQLEKPLNLRWDSFRKKSSQDIFEEPSCLQNPHRILTY